MQNPELEKNILSTYAKQGAQWLDDLPKIIQALSLHWQLSDLQPVENMSYNYVVITQQRNKQKVVLKVSCDAQAISKEYKALQDFTGIGAINAIDYLPAYNALLLQLATPGTMLKELYPTNQQAVMQHYTACVQKLHSHPMYKCNYQHISSWLHSLDAAVSSNKLPQNLLQQAIMLKNKLLTRVAEPRLLHGDLHLGNILQHENNWLAIDPKGILGCLEFEIAAFDFIVAAEIPQKNLQDLFLSRIVTLAEYTKLDPELIRQWVFVRLVLSAAWSVEDNGDPKQSILLAQVLHAV